MANTPISGFPSGAPAQSGDQVVIARAGANYSLLNSDLKTLIVGAGSVSIASGKTLTASNTLTLAGTDGSTLNVGTGGTLGVLATVSAGTGVATAAGNAVNGSGGFITYATFAPASGKTLTVSNTLTLAGTDGTTMTFPSASGTVATLNAANLFTKANTFQPDSDAQAGTFRRNSSGQTANVVEIQTEANAFLAAFDKTGALTIGAASGNTGALKLAGTTSGTVTLSTADAAGTWTMKLPTSGGTNGYVLSTDGSGNTSWVAQSGGSVTLTVGSTATSGGAAGQLMFDTGSVLSESSSLVWNDTTKLLTATGLGTGGGANTGGLTVSGGSFSLSGNISANAWTTSGIRYKSVAATLTDLTSTGTVATAYTNVYGGNTIAASNATTFTDYFTTFITQPTAGTNVTFTNRWALGLSGNLRVAGTQTIATGTITTSQPALDLSQTWNASGTNFTGIKLNATNTASGASSLLMDLQVGTVSKFSVDKNGSINCGNITIPNGSTITASGLLIFGTGSTYSMTVRETSVALSSATTLVWTNGNSFTDTKDLFISRAAAATLQLGAADAASPVAQTLQVQNVVAGTSNTAGTNFTINGSRGTGTGAGGSIIFQVAPAGTSGTSQNALATALTIASDKSAAFSGTVDLSSQTSPTVKGGQYLELTTTAYNVFLSPSSARVLTARSTYVGIVGVPFGFSANATTAPNAMFTSPSAATLQMGDANAASPVSQTLQAQGSRSGTDSNVAGANLTIQSGNGTGTGTPSILYLKSPVKAASGTGAQTQTTGLSINVGTAVLSSYTYASIPAATDAGSGALIVVTDSGQTSGQITSGGGANKVLAISNGTNWYVVFLVP